MQNAERRDINETNQLCTLHSAWCGSQQDNTVKVAGSIRMGVLFCLIAALLYSCANICYKELGLLNIDVRWTLCIKEMICVTCVSSAILYLAVRRRYVWPKWRWVAFLFIGGFLCEYIGARLHLWTIGTIGLVVSIPLIQASNMVCSAGIGHAFLGERVGKRCRVAMVVMLLAIGCLFFGPHHHDVGRLTQQLGGNALFLGVIGAVVAGVAYAIYIVFLRRSSNSRQMPISFIAAEVTGIGAMIFGFEILRDHGFQISAFWQDVPPRAWLLVGVAGLMNMVGFLFQITGLRYTVVVRAQMISVSQIVIGTMFGVLIYSETTNAMIWLGVTLAVLGIVIVSTPNKKELTHADSMRELFQQ